MLSPVEFPQGIVRGGTEYQSRGHWLDSSLVRFIAGTIQPVGGWVRVNSVALTGRPCSVFGWRPNSTTIGRYLAAGTEQKAYAYSGSTTTDITPAGFTTGRTAATSTQGYGAGLYGMGSYGTVRTGNAGIRPVDAWHFDAWGEQLVACYTADGRLLYWDLNTANDLVPITNAPTQCKGLVVTAERMLMALAAGGDRRKVQWSHQEDFTSWTAGPTTTAGDFLLTTDGQIITAERIRGGILIHTDTDVHVANYIGGQFQYGFDRVGDNCGIASANAKVVASSFAVWMGNKGFFIYDGYVRPLPCAVQDYVFGRINPSQISKVCAWHNGDPGEIWWFYPSGTNENNSYVVWNYRENHWTIGALARTACMDRGAWDFPICTDSSGYWYHHENGYLDNGAERGSTVFLESGPTELVPGERTVWLNQVIHDESDAANKVQLKIKTKFTPEGTETTAGPYAFSASSGYTDVRALGRAYKIRLEETASGAWRLGTLRMDVKVSGKR